MQPLLRLVLLVALAASPAGAQIRNVGPVVLDYNSKSIAVRVSANTAELNNLALLAFGTHGRYRLEASGYAYDIRFSQLSPTQVRVDITKGSAGAPFASEVATGTTARHALLRAADIAVAKTNGLGLRGYFTARLAFVGERTGKKEIYVSDLFLGETKQITNNRALVLKPHWSPDGTRLIYTSFFKSGFPDIFVYHMGTFQQTSFVSFRGTNMGARFSPSGQQVAMVLTGEGAQEIYISDANGRGVARKTRSDAVKSSPCWSPDGGQLVFEMEPGPQLYVMSAAGGAPRRLMTGYNFSSEPDWSTTDRNKIACTVRVPGGKFQIAVYDLSTGKAEVASKATFDGVSPSWLADGRHLVYTARDRSTSALCILDTETGKTTVITPPGFGAAMEASVWTP